MQQTHQVYGGKMSDQIKELVKRLREKDDFELAAAADDAAAALEAMAGEVAFVKAQLAGTNKNIAGWLQARDDANLRAAVAEIERDRLKAALEALEAVRSDLPEKVSEQWLYEGVRHWHRNCDWDEPRDGSPLNRGDGATVAKILNMIPRKALGGDA